MAASSSIISARLPFARFLQVGGKSEIFCSQSVPGVRVVSLKIVFSLEAGNILGLQLSLEFLPPSGQTGDFGACKSCIAIGAFNADSQSSGGSRRPPWRRKDKRTLLLASQGMPQ